MRAIAGLLAVLVLPGCASIVTGTSQTMALASEPAGATCKLERGGETIGFVNQTPSTASFSKSSKPIVVSCAEEAKNLRGVSTVQPNIQPWFFGNLLLGGIVGIIVDASSGAISEYPSSTTVVMNPTQGAAPTASVQPASDVPAQPAALDPSSKPIS
jgi:hypothetical protein